jgi:hypothetical protein
MSAYKHFSLVLLYYMEKLGHERNDNFSYGLLHMVGAGQQTD